MKLNKTLGFVLFVVYLAVISIAGCSQNIVATVVPAEPGKVVKRGPVEDKISISRHASVALSDEDADKILEVATKVAQSEDGPGDVPCDVTLARDPDVPVAEFTHPHTPSFIDSSKTYRAVANDSLSDVKVIAGSNWCDKFIPNVLGCTPLSDSPIIVVSGLPQNLRGSENEDQVKGIVWLHEYGHLKGLEHRNDSNAVMHEEIELDHTHLNEAECG